MKVHKIEVMVLDFEDVGHEEIRTIIENSKHLHAHVMGSKFTEIEWSDDHPLNKCGTMAKTYHELFESSQLNK